MKDADIIHVPLDLESDIKKRIRGKVAIVGIGNILRGDDGLGSRLIEMLRPEGIKANLFDCGTAPENYVFPILSSASDTIIFVDAADVSREPGSVSVLELEGVSRVSFSTHSPSPRLFIDLLKTGRDDLNIFFIVVQPKSTALGNSLSDEVKMGLERLKNVLAGILKN